jgi:hypothetical protein
MTRYFYDTEFLENGRTIELISIGIVAEDGREYYAVNRDAPWKRIKKHDWLMANVVPTLPTRHGDARIHAGRGPLGLLDWQHPAFKRPAAIANQVKNFLLADREPELWAYYGAYDHIVLCQLFGTMMNLPEGMPMWTHELMQAWEQAGRPDMPDQHGSVHNALEDARWNRDLFRALHPGEAMREQCPCYECVSPTWGQWESYMVLCPDCGNKRCPHATFHGNACTGSNKSGQPGSRYAALHPGEA